MRKNPAPSIAQAKLIARLWGLDREVSIGGKHIDPTKAACVKRGWLVPSGQTGKFPSGGDYAIHVLSPSALPALEDFLREQRWKKHQ